MKKVVTHKEQMQISTFKISQFYKCRVEDTGWNLFCRKKKPEILESQKQNMNQKLDKLDGKHKE